MLQDEGWRPSITVKQLLLGIQELLDTPNPNSPAQVRHQPCAASLLLYCELQDWRRLFLA